MRGELAKLLVALRRKSKSALWRVAREVAEFYGRRGKMLRLEVDSEQKTISIEVQLKGQSAPLQLRGIGYTVTSEPGQERIQFEGVEASEEWLGTVLRFTKAAQKGVPLPPQYAELIRLAL